MTDKENDIKMEPLKARVEQLEKDLDRIIFLRNEILQREGQRRLRWHQLERKLESIQRSNFQWISEISNEITRVYLHQNDIWRQLGHMVESNHRQTTRLDRIENRLRGPNKPEEEARHTTSVAELIRREQANRKN